MKKIAHSLKMRSLIAALAVALAVPSPAFALENAGAAEAAALEVSVTEDDAGEIGAEDMETEAAPEEELAEEIPEEILRLYAENPELLSAACAETGWNRALIENRIAQLPPAEHDSGVPVQLCFPREHFRSALFARGRSLGKHSVWSSTPEVRHAKEEPPWGQPLYTCKNARS